MKNLLVFETFSEKEHAYRTAATLENNSIFVSIEENLLALDSNFVGQQFNNPFVIKIPANEFERAREVLLIHTIIDLEEVDPDYVLLSFSNHELLEVLKNQKDWGIYNYKLAEKLLESRGVKLSEEAITEANEQKEEVFARPQQYDPYWIVIGYAMALLSMVVVYWKGSPMLFTFPAFFALVVGYLLFFSKKTLSNGTRVLAYNKASRYHGMAIFLIAAVLAVVRIINLFDQ